MLLSGVDKDKFTSNRLLANDQKKSGDKETGFRKQGQTLKFVWSTILRNFSCLNGDISDLAFQWQFGDTFCRRLAFAKPHCNSKKRINFAQLSVDRSHLSAGVHHRWHLFFMLWPDCVWCILTMIKPDCIYFSIHCLNSIILSLSLSTTASIKACVISYYFRRIHSCLVMHSLLLAGLDSLVSSMVRIWWSWFEWVIYKNS